MRVGLTGGIACGKSTVSGMFKKQGAVIVDADLIAREVVSPGEEAWRGIVERFGQDILLDNQEINRPKLGAIVFADEQSRLDLNGIVHPAVRQRMNEQAAKAEEEGAPLVILDIPLLFESGLQYLVEKVVVVYCPMELQVERLMKRNQYSREEAMQRIQSQWPIEKKREQADYVIDNSSDLAETEKQVESLVQRLINGLRPLA